MRGWIIPPPKAPTKSKAVFQKERNEKVRWLVERGYLKSERIKHALLTIPREDFIPADYRDYAYLELPFPLPGTKATISCPHSYPLFYEPLGPDEGHRFLEIGTGSGYGAAVACEVVGPAGLVVTVEIDATTLAFARGNLERAGYHDVVLVHGDGGLGYLELAPYDTISVSAACRRIPPPLVNQLSVGGRLIAPVHAGETQDLVLLEKRTRTVRREVVAKVLYISLRGTYGS